MAPH